MANLILDYVRRIEKLIIGSRPKVPPVGTNHVDDYSQWTSDTLYKGELGININDGTLFTQDGARAVELNKENSIMGGHILQTSGVSSQYLSVTQGAIRLNGKTWWTPTPVDVADTNIFIDANVSSYPRIDTICIRENTSKYYAPLDLYGTEFQVVKGTPATEPEAPDVPNGWYFVGVVWTFPNGLPTSTLYPLSHSMGTLSTFPLPVITTKDFIQRRRITVYPWSINLLLFSQQIVKHNQQLYYVIVTHQSSGSNIQDDIDDGKIIKICCDGGGGGYGYQGPSGVTYFSDIGSTPTDGNWNDGAFTWTSGTRILDAIDDINEFLLSMSLSGSGGLNSNNITIELGNGFSGRWYDNNKGVLSNSVAGAIESYIFGDNDLPMISSASPFKSFENGSISGFGTFNGTPTSTSAHTVTPTSHPPSTLYTVTGSNLSLGLTKNDAFAGNSELEGKLYNDFTFELSKTGGLLSASDNTVHEMGITYISTTNGTATESIEFYVENIGSTPALDNIDVKGVWTSKYVSGVPVLEAGDVVNFSFDAENCVGYFYHKDHIVKIMGPLVAETNLPETDPSCTSSLPFTAITQVVNFTDAEADVMADAYSTSLTQEFDLKVYNAKGFGADGFADVTTSSYKIYVDDLSVETGVRYLAGSGSFPTSGYGALYTGGQSQQSLTLNEELQLWCGTYRYPQGNYTASDMIDVLTNSVNGPNYSGITGTRWALFNLGTITNEKFITFLIKGAGGITEDFANGTTMTTNLKLQIRVNGSTPTTGWIDANEAYDPLIVDIPDVDGDPALDLGSSSATLRRVTFGPESKSGTVYARIGFNNTAGITFTDIVRYNPPVINQDWAVFELTTISAKTLLKFSIDNSNGTIIEDFSDGIRMTNNFEVQVQVVGASGTDWVDANATYSSGSPALYGDFALDVPNSSATDRQVTFGSTPRTGVVYVRMRGLYKVFSGVTFISAS